MENKEKDIGCKMAASPSSDNPSTPKTDDDSTEVDDPRPMITNRGFLPSTVIMLFFAVSIHTTRWAGQWSGEFVSQVVAMGLMIFMFEWQRRRARFTYGRLETRPYVDLMQLYQKQPYVRPDGSVILATSVEAALVKMSVIGALYRKQQPEENPCGLGGMQ